MKFVHFLILLIFFCFSCKEEKKETASPTLNPEETVGYYEDLYKYFHAHPETQAQKDENAIIDYIAAKKLKPLRTPSGLYYQIIEEGYGATFKTGDDLSVHYVGTFLNTQFFDSSYSRGKPVNFKIGQMIAGWNEGFTYLKPGSRAILIIPSHLAYGEKGMGNLVPPNKPLVFEVAVVE